MDNENDNFIVVNTSEADEVKPLAEKVETQLVAEQTEETQEETESVETEGDDGGEESTEQTEEVKPKKKGGWLKKLEKADAKIAELEAKLQTKGKPDVTETVVELKEPEEKDFETVGDYYRALAKFEAQKVKEDLKKEAKENETKSKVASDFAEKQKTYVAKAEAYTKENPTFQEDIQKDFDEHGEGLKFSPLVNDFLLNSEAAPGLVHSFVKDRDLLEKINQMPLVDAARELVKLEQSLIKPKAITKTTSTAPKPIQPSSGKGNIVPKKDINDPNLSQRDFEKLMDELERKRA